MIQSSIQSTAGNPGRLSVKARWALALLTTLVLPLSAPAVQADEVAAWGSDSAGQVTNTPSGTGFTAIATGGDHGYALAADGSITAWGADGAGQVSNTPTGTGFTAIAAGFAHGYALAADGSIAAWGDNFGGQVSNTPPGSGFTAIAAGEYHGYALAAGGSIVAWGWDSNGQVSNTPSGPGFTAIAAGDRHGNALAANGSITGWGYDGFGQASNTPPGTGFTAIATGFGHGYALAADGSIAAWGYNGNGQVTNTPMGADFTAIAAGNYHGFALYQPGSWDDLGGGTVGVNGLVTASGGGPLTAGSFNTLTVTDAAPLQPMLAWVSLNATPFNALGGTVHAYPFNAQLFLFTNAGGGFSAAASWPAGIPSGTKVWFQFIVQDFTSMHGLTLSNGLLATTP